MEAKILISVVIVLMVIANTMGYPRSIRSTNLEMDELLDLAKKKSQEYVSFHSSVMYEFSRTKDPNVNSLDLIIRFALKTIIK